MKITWLCHFGKRRKQDFIDRSGPGFLCVITSSASGYLAGGGRTHKRSWLKCWFLGPADLCNLNVWEWEVKLCVFNKLTRKTWFETAFRNPRLQPDLLDADGRGPWDGEEAGSRPHSILRAFSSQTVKASPHASPRYTTIITTITEHRHVLGSFTCIISFARTIILPPIYRWGTWGPQRGSNLL